MRFQWLTRQNQETHFYCPISFQTFRVKDVLVQTLASNVIINVILILHCFWSLLLLSQSIYCYLHGGHFHHHFCVYYCHPCHCFCPCHLCQYCCYLCGVDVTAVEVLWIHTWPCNRFIRGFNCCHLNEASSLLLCICPTPSCNNID